MARPMPFLWGAHGARTAKLLRTGHRHNDGYPLAWSLRGVDAFGQGECCVIDEEPSPEGPSPMVQPTDCSRSACKPFCSARPQGRALAKHSAKRFQRRAGHRHGGRKVSDNHSPSPRQPAQPFPTFFTHPLALPTLFCYTCNRQRWAGPSEEARENPIPLRIERKKE